MSRFKDMKGLDEAVNAAALKNDSTVAANTKEAPNGKKTKVNRMVYAIPPEWLGLLSDAGEDFSGYARRAIREQMKRDGIS